MSLNDTITKLESLLLSVVKDLEKVKRANKAAAQRVRVGTIRLERVAVRPSPARPRCDHSR